MRFREPMPLFEAYRAAWSVREAHGSDAVAPLYLEIRRAGLDAFLAVSNPILDLVTECWETGIPPDRFEREFSRRWWLLLGRSLTRAVGAEVSAVRAVLKDLA